MSAITNNYTKGFGGQRTPTTSVLAGTNVRLHTAKMKPKDKKERHLKHDDCCRYCERYCDDKITERKRREIEAWRHDVPQTRNQTNKPPTKVADNPKSVSTGSQNSDVGFKWIPTPHELKKVTPNIYKSIKKRQKSEEGNVKETSDLPSRVMQLSLKCPDTKYDVSGSLKLDSGQLVPVSRSPAVLSTTFSRDSLDDSFLCEHKEEDILFSEYSNRSSSNELLNVITIDDAIKHHRDQLLNSKKIQLVETWTERPTAIRQKCVRPITTLTQNETRLMLQSSASPESQLRELDPSHEYGRYPHSAGLSQTVNQASVNCHMKSRDLTLNKLGSTAITGLDTRGQLSRHDFGHQVSRNCQSVPVKVTDNDIGDHCRRQAKYQRFPVTSSKPKSGSRRFQKMNQHLRELIDEEYIFDQRKLARLKMYHRYARQLMVSIKP